MGQRSAGGDYSFPLLAEDLEPVDREDQGQAFFNLLKRLRPIHKTAGILLALVAGVHGLMALNGRLTLHTGSLVYLGFLLTVLLGIRHHFKKDKRVFKGHKTMALISFLLFILHLVEPWALGKWFQIW